MADDFTTLVDRILSSLLADPLRKAVFARASGAGGDAPEALRPLIDKIARHAYKVTDDDYGKLRAAYDEDRLFEVTLAAATGAAWRRLDRGLAALRGGRT